MWLYVDDKLDRLDIEAALRAMSPQRREHAMRYRRETDRRQSLAVYLLLCRALSERFGITEPPVLYYDDRGKPAVDGRPDVHISLSHCKAAVAVAVASQPVGVDIESLITPDIDLLRHTMSEAECATILKDATQFTRLWTMKESFLKLTGEGLTDDLPNVLTRADGVRFSTTVHSHYVVTSATYKDVNTRGKKSET